MEKISTIHLSQKPTYIKLGHSIDFYGLFKKIERKFETCFILESLGEQGAFSRYSIIGFDPERVISSRDTTFEGLRDLMPRKTIAKHYAGGLIGYMNYEAVNYFEPSLRLKDHPDFERFLFGVYTDGIIFDTLANEIIYFYYDRDRRAVVQELLSSKPVSLKVDIAFLKHSLTKEKFQHGVASIKKEISAGNVFQCEAGFKSMFRIRGDDLEIYGRLRTSNPSPFMYYLKFGRKRIIGASPELLFSLRDGEMQTQPLAGTTGRGKNRREDERLVRELLSDPKERAEHTMLIDLHRNDIGRVAQFGTVKVRDLMTVKKFRYVQHLSSEVVGIIRKGEDMFSGLAANFPAGTVTGAPKIEAMKIISRNETLPRGPYGGAVGHFGFNGDCTFALAIRTLFISDSKAFTQTSAGIVADSQPQKEYDEILRKLAGTQKALGINL